MSNLIIAASSVATFFITLAHAEEQVDIYEGKLPESEKQTLYQDAAQWTGTVVLRDISTNDDFHPEHYGNVNSIVEFNGITPAFLPETGFFAGTIKLTDQSGGKKAWVMGDGYGTATTGYVISRLTGNGEYEDTYAKVTQQITINDGSSFIGNLTIKSKRWVFGTTVVGNAGNGKITVQDGQTISFARQTWSAKNGVTFGETLNVIGEVGSYISMVSAPNVFPTSVTLKNAANETVAGDYVLSYSEGALRVVRAGALDKNGAKYETAEAAIATYGGAQVTILKDTVLDVGKLKKGAKFTINRQGYAFCWTDAENRMIVLEANTGKFNVVEGHPDNGLTSFQCYLLGLKPQAGEGEEPDKPFVKAISSKVVDGVAKTTFNFFHTATGTAISPREDTGKTAMYQLKYAATPNADGWMPVGEPTAEGAVMVELPQPNESESVVRYYKPAFSFQ